MIASCPGNSLIDTDPKLAASYFFIRAGSVSVALRWLQSIERRWVEFTQEVMRTSNVDTDSLSRTEADQVKRLVDLDA